MLRWIPLLVLLAACDASTVVGPPGPDPVYVAVTPALGHYRITFSEPVVEDYGGYAADTISLEIDTASVTGFAGATSARVNASWQNVMGGYVFTTMAGGGTASLIARFGLEMICGGTLTGTEGIARPLSDCKIVTTP